MEQIPKGKILTKALFDDSSYFQAKDGPNKLARLAEVLYGIQIKVIPNCLKK